MRGNTVRNESLIQWLRPAFVMAAIFLAVSVFVSCESERSFSPGPARDSLTAVVEGVVLPESDSFQVVLSRGESVIRTVSREGYFQFKDVEYGLYILSVTADGYGEYRSLVTVGDDHVFLDRIRIGKLPWPISQWTPSDSLVQQSMSGSSRMVVQFSRNMDRQSVEGALSINPDVPFQLEWEPDWDFLGDVLYVSFETGALAKDVRHVLTLAASAKTLSGLPLEAKVEYPVIDRRERGNPLVTLFDRRRYIEPGYAVPVEFSEKMNLASVRERLFLKPPVPYRTEWNPGQNVLYVTPETRWPVGQDLEMGLYAGYTTVSGTVGAEISSRVEVENFRVISPAGGTLKAVEDQVEMHFNLPIDMLSLRYSLDKGVTATPLKTASSRILWSISGYEKGSVFTLRIDSLASLFGDELELPASFMFEPSGAPATFRFLDSAYAAEGLLPFGETFRLSSSWAGYTRLKDADFTIFPAYPASIQWESTWNGTGVLKVSFSQPIPAGAEFMLFPDSGAIAGDTMHFSTRALEAALVRPYYGEERVLADEAIAILWNSPIDTVGFAAHVTIDPPVDSLRFGQEADGFGWKTVMRHNGFVENKTYKVIVHGVTDLFARSMKDSLELRFTTAP